MSRVFPFKRPVTHEPAGSKLVGLTDEVADEVFATLSSATARAILEALYDEPHSPTDLKEVTGTTLQNIHYHLTNMENAGLIEVVETWYSEKGAPMKVYAPSSRALLVMASSHEDRGILSELLKRVFAVVLFLGAASLALGQALDWLAARALEAAESPRVAPAAEAFADGASSAPPATAAAESVAWTLPPELAFFLGGLVAVTLFLAISRLR
ncbi:ArsR/SmtB family transcription factor [Haloarchaeobius sp. TZWWS8]|uniref:ArsR/SmtB family transcription factor n=1 Tax=Haloarchaeobius sp. TZWWS8 TaxID=3446121 RepID=UPI003EBC25F2